MNPGDAHLLAAFAKDAMDGRVGAFLSEAEFFHARLKDDGGGSAGVDGKVAGFAVGINWEAVGVLVANKLTSTEAVGHHVLAKRIEGHGAFCARRGKRGKEKDRKTGEQSGHQAGKHRDPVAVNHEDKSALQLSLA